MEASEEIRSALKNINYYSQKIVELARQQMELDTVRGLEMDSPKWNCMATIISACSWLETYCINIEHNLKVCEKPDKVMTNVK